jgi:hypothetical protein
MPDLDQMKQGVRERRRPARDGQSGNPGRQPVATAGYATSYAQMVTDWIRASSIRAMASSRSSSWTPKVSI